MSHSKMINISTSCIHKYENLKRTPYNFNANIHFIQAYLIKQPTPNYARIKVPNTSTASTTHNTKYPR